MPYNTRRKSLSLTELGITLPKRSRTHSQSSPSHANTTAAAQSDEPPTKKSKRASTPPSALSAQTESKSPARSSVTTTRFKEDGKKHTPSGAQQLSPPPSPVAEGARANRVDVEGINDDIVVATIRQLEQTGNRPHLVKELAAILSSCLDSAEKYDYPAASLSPALRNTAIAQSVVIGDEHDVEYRRLQNANKILNRSTNPSALISSRLTAYISRPWPAVCPCPLAKDLTTAHPRRLYFYLTTLPRQPLPPSIAALAASGPKSSQGKRHLNGTISPSLSSAENSSSSSTSASDDVSDDADNDALLLRQRQALSPSPEVDLSSPDLYDEAGRTDHHDRPGEPFSGRSSVDPNPSSTSGFEGPGSSVAGAGGGSSRGLRGSSPQLENEERDFKRVATAVYEEEMRRRQRSRSATEGVKAEEVEGSVVKKEGSPSANSMTASELGGGAGNTNASSRSSPSSLSAASSAETKDVEMSDGTDRAENHASSSSISSTIEDGAHAHGSSFFNAMEAEDDGYYGSTEHQRQNREAAAALFGSEHLPHSPEMRSLGFYYGGSSPVIAPRDAPAAPSLAALARDGGIGEVSFVETGAGEKRWVGDGEVAPELAIDGGRRLGNVDDVKLLNMDSEARDSDEKMDVAIQGNGEREIEHATTAHSMNAIRSHGPVSRTALSSAKSIPHPTASNASHGNAGSKDQNVMIIDPEASEDAIRAAEAEAEAEADDWAKSLQSPETVELEELEDLFDAY